MFIGNDSQCLIPQWAFDICWFDIKSVCWGTCMYVCMSVCLYVCMSVCTCTCMCICICICIETLCCMCVKHCKRSKPVESWALNFNRSLSANSYDATLPIDFGRTGNPSPRVCLLLRLVPWPSECWSHHPPGEMQCLRYAQHKHTCKTPLGVALVVLKYSMFKVFETACWATADTSNETHTQDSTLPVAVISERVDVSKFVKKRNRVNSLSNADISKWMQMHDR